MVENRLGNRLKIAAQLWSQYLQDSLTSPRQLDQWLSLRLRAEKRFGSQDRRFYSDVLFAAARVVTSAVFVHSIGCSAERLLQESEEKRNELIDRFSHEVKTEEQLWAKIRQLSPESLTEAAHSTLLTTLVSSTDLGQFENDRRAVVHYLRARTEWTAFDYQLALIAHGIPPTWANALRQRANTSGWTQEQLITFLKMQNERPPLWIRLNQASARERVEQDFAKHALTAEWMENQISAKVSGTFGVYQTESFKAGLFEVQDWASQQISKTVQARPGQKIWDACAGGGGKTVAVATAMQGKGALYASDIREHKLDEARRRCQRAGFYNLRTLPWDGQKTPDFGKEITVNGGFDAVLVDAPCSSSGTWRRNPDARLRISDDEKKRSLLQLQRELVLSALRSLKPSGRLIYGTCSWCVDENEDVLRFVVESLTGSTVSDVYCELFGSPDVDSDTMFSASFCLRIRD